MEENYFTKLVSIDVSSHIEKKNGLDYLSWAWAWAELKKIHPDAIFTIYENKDGFNYHHDGRTAWVKTGVTVNGIEYIEYLPVMDFRNQSIPLDKITSTAVNKTIQRSLTKAVARHGLGLSLYAGEDIPCEDNSLTSSYQSSANQNNIQQNIQPQQPVNQTYPQNTLQQQSIIQQNTQQQPVQTAVVNDSNFEEIKRKILGYITSGILVGTFADKANMYIQEKNMNGLAATIGWCEKQQQARQQA